MGNFDGAESCELVASFLLHLITVKHGNKGPVTLHNDNDTINCNYAIIWKKIGVSIHTTTIKL